MTTLPPEGSEAQPTGAEATPASPEPQAPAGAAPQPGTTPQPEEQPQGTPEVPVAPQVPAPPTPPLPPQAPAYAAPQQPSVQPPQYTAPPAAGAYQAPPAGAYQAPPAGGYQPPPPGGYQQPPLGYQQPATDPLTNITLNYWLSVFFSWIPALIFYIVEKDKGNQQAFVYHRDNLNFSLLRVGVGLATWILGAIPVLGGILAVILGIGSVVLFVFHIIAAAKAPEGFRRGEQPGFILNIPLVK